VLFVSSVNKSKGRGAVKERQGLGAVNTSADATGEHVQKMARGAGAELTRMI
jgi:hypothetical protein